MPPDSEHAGSMVVLTGAGVSAESGVRTFRDLGGLWERYRIEDVATPEAFARDPDTVHRFYNERRRLLLSGEVEPNAAHHALARLDERFDGDFLLVTQNIDDLHERAGSRRLVHMHGELLKARCGACERVTPASGDLHVDDTCGACGARGAGRPHVVWFGEIPMEMELICDRLQRCDLFLAVGTSGQVYPAAGFVELARRAGARTIEVNVEETGPAGAFDRRVTGKAGDTLPPLVEKLLGDRG